ncbi:hypothetical protein ACHAPT_003834 [Fusarium lateritium]
MAGRYVAVNLSHPLNDQEEELLKFICCRIDPKVTEKSMGQQHQDHQDQLVSQGWWLISEDLLTTTWRNAVVALGKNKNDVKARWKKIKDQPAKNEPDIASSSIAAETKDDISSEAETVEESEAESDEESDDYAPSRRPGNRPDIASRNYGGREIGDCSAMGNG